MGSGNYLVDRMDAEMSRCRTCPECRGEGSVSWDSIRDGFELMADAISFRIFKRKKNGFACKSFREMLSIAREVKKEGADCPMCDGSGEVII
jgi:DnaJ-class molecular chaperone